jgi:uncharacterized protein YjbI with pentapeptide repeats
MFHVKHFGTIGAKILTSLRSSASPRLVRWAEADVFAAIGARGRAAMSDDPKEPASGAGEPTLVKTRAEDNHWYLLATLYGVPRKRDDELREKNRISWNRYFATDLDEETRARLIKQKRHPADELTPFSPEELREVSAAFAERRRASGNAHEIPCNDRGINFSNVEFEHDASFRQYLFSRISFFRHGAFLHSADFGGATFFDADFGGATFSSGADFYGATFSEGAHFSRATFSGVANFRSATFSRVAYFSDTTFSRATYFVGAAFLGKVDFHGATFSGAAFLNGATFSGGADFNGATFSGVANFGKAILDEWVIFTSFGETSSFVNAEMKGETSFEGAIFKNGPPKFFGAKLHQGTVWRGITWPPTPKDKDEVGACIDAYACLKLEMDRLKKHEDELNFFVLELQSRRVLAGPWRGFPIAIYGIFSDYGRSYLRPLVSLFVVMAIGAVAFWYFDARTFGEALGLSSANTLSVFGFRRDFGLEIDTPLAQLKVLAAIQTILGTILLFLFGLGIRNRFRMK